MAQACMVKNKIHIIILDTQVKQARGQPSSLATRLAPEFFRWFC